MRDLSQKMFNTLQNDPKNFERQCSILRHRVGRRKQNVSSGRSTAGLAPKGRSLVITTRSDIASNKINYVVCDNLQDDFVKFYACQAKVMRL